MKKLAVVTGGTKGIGKAIIEKFMSEGFDIITCSRKIDELAQLRAELSEKFPSVEALAIRADLAEKADVLQFAHEVKSVGIPVDVLVNNTGVFIPGQIHSEPEHVLEKLIETNLYSAYYLTRALLPSMMQAKKGHIFNICSTASITPYINGGSYCISKYALYGMTKVLREEMKQHQIRVTAVLPGATKTASWDGVQLPDERFMRASDVANTIFAAYQLSGNTVIEELIMRPQEGDI
jgi:short-subunit dehydrogenase